jgi:hypothetical protein
MGRLELCGLGGEDVMTKPVQSKHGTGCESGKRGGRVADEGFLKDLFKI